MIELIETKDGVVRLSREAGSHEIRRAVLNKTPIYVLADSWNSDMDNVLFIHGNKKGKRIYRTHRSKVVLNSVSSQKEQKKGNFADLISDDLKAKLMKPKVL